MRAHDKTGAALWDEYLDNIRERMMGYFSSYQQTWSDPELSKLESPQPKPEELIFLERLEYTRLPFLEGGYIDQPHSLMQILTVTANARAMYRPKGGA